MLTSSMQAPPYLFAAKTGLCESEQKLTNLTGALKTLARRQWLPALFAASQETLKGEVR